MVVRLEVWIVYVTRLRLHEPPSTLELIHISQSRYEEVSGATGSLHDHSISESVLWQRFLLTLVFTLKCALKHRRACITV